jgi:hypothetical protein
MMDVNSELLCLRSYNRLHGVMTSGYRLAASNLYL